MTKALRRCPVLVTKIALDRRILAAFAALSSTAIVPVANVAVFHNGTPVAGDAAATWAQQVGSYRR